MATRAYILPLDAISVTNDADQDIFGLGTSATKQLILHEIRLSTSNTTDERLRMQLIRRTGVGSGGSAVTASPADQGNAIAASTTCRVLDTAPGTGSTILHCFQWSQQGEFLYLPAPEDRLVVSVSAFLVLHLQTAVGGTRTWSGSVTFEEI